MNEADNRFLERLKGYREGQPRLGPETVHLDVTNACNLDCVTCWNYAPQLTTPKDTAWKRQRIDPEVFVRVLDEVTRVGAERIVVSGGGEPFTHPELPRLLQAVKDRGLRVTLITNGTLADFELLRSLAIDQVLLNVASATAETYAAYHPNSPAGSFERLVEGANHLRDACQVNLVQVVNAVNAHELTKMVELAAEVGARCSFKVGDTPAGTERYALTPGTKARLLVEGIPQARVRARALGVRHNLDAWEAALRGTPQTLVPCYAGYLYSRIAVDGRIFFCCAHLEVGHVDDGPFAATWRSARYEAMRKRLHQGDYFSVCARCGKHDLNFSAHRALESLLFEEPA